jgi:hypothetical protein
MTRIAVICIALLPALATAQSTPQTKPAKLSASAIQIEPVDAGDVIIPAEFQFAIYERLIERVRHDGEFKTVLRGGDRAASGIPDLVILRTKVSGYKEGSQLKRELTTVSGGTTVEVTTTVSAPDGKVLLNNNVSGKVHFFGENLGVANDLAKHIAKILSQNF